MGIQLNQIKGDLMIVNAKAAKLFCMVAVLAVFSIESSAADSAKEVAALEAVDQSWGKVYNAGDVDTLASLYGEIAMLFPPGALGANGRTAIRAFLAKDTEESAKAGVVFSLGPKPASPASAESAAPPKK